MRFYLGTHQVCWLGRTDVPLFVSRVRLIQYRYDSLPAARGPWALDSGAFSELAAHGRWTVPPRQYLREVCRWLDRPGNLEWWAPQDWMCEPHMVAKTGLSVREHQVRTLENYLLLADWCPWFPPAPVLQGWVYEDYFRHLDDFKGAGVDLRESPLVGLGSVCRRQNTEMVERLVRDLSARGIRLHGFGLKTEGLARVGDSLASADSMAWSLNARKHPPLPGCTHRSCANCLRWALRWREKVLRAADAARSRPVYADLFTEDA